MTRVFIINVGLNLAKSLIYLLSAISNILTIDNDQSKLKHFAISRQISRYICQKIKTVYMINVGLTIAKRLLYLLLEILNILTIDNNKAIIRSLSISRQIGGLTGINARR